MPATDWCTEEDDDDGDGVGPAGLGGGTRGAGGRPLLNWRVEERRCDAKHNDKRCAAMVGEKWPGCELAGEHRRIPKPTNPRIASSDNQRIRKGAHPKVHNSTIEMSEPSADASTPALWRTDPEESFSDWKIVVRIKDDAGNKADQTYHVHKVIIAAGEHKCNYFAHVCRSKNFAESETQTSTVELPSLLAEALPLLLDYVYGRGLPQKFANQAVSLYHLAQYFDNEPLMNKVKEQINKTFQKIEKSSSFDHDDSELVACMMEHARPWIPRSFAKLSWQLGQTLPCSSASQDFL